MCQASKQTSQQKALLINLPVGKPWEMIAVDILQVPLSSHNNKYLLVIQDYFTKWAKAVPLSDQTDKRITRKCLLNMAYPQCSTLIRGIILKVPCYSKHGIRKSRTTVYYPECDGMVEWFNCTLLQLLRTQKHKKNGNAIYLFCYLCIVLQCILQLEYLHSN